MNTPPLSPCRCCSTEVSPVITETPRQRTAICRKCGTVTRLVRTFTPEGARRFVMPFGVHRGLTLEQIAREPRGLDMLRFVGRGKAGSGDVIEAIRVFLAFGGSADRRGDA